MKDINILVSAGADINKSLELLGDMETYNDVLKDFLDMIDEKINNLNKYKSINDMASYAIDVHSLKSDVRYLGFMALGELAYELELLSKQNDLVSVSGKHDNLINEVNKMVSACKTYLYGQVSSAPVAEATTNVISDTTSLDPMSEAIMYQGSQVNSETQTPSVKNGVILIVDDSQITSNFIKKVFETDYDIVIANDGREAIEYLSNDENRNKVKSCLLDLNMPNVNGFEVLDFLNQNNYFVKLPVVVISGVEEVELIEKAKSYPIVDILLKPFNERDAIMGVNKCLATYF